MNSEKSIKYYWIFDEASHQLKVVSNKEMETKTVRNAENRKFYNGLSVLPHSYHIYKQAPFEDCTKEEYEEMIKNLQKIDLTKVVEIEDNTNLAGELACAGGACEIK